MVHEDLSIFKYYILANDDHDFQKLQNRDKNEPQIRM